MTNLNILIVEGNDPKNNEFFIKAAKASCSENLKNLVLKLEPNSKIEIINPSRDDQTKNALENIKDYHGIIFTGGAMRLNDMTDEIKKHINFASSCYQYENKILAICWGLQVCSVAAGGKVAPGKKGAHVGIASDIEINEEGRKNPIYKDKKLKFTSPAFNYDEVCEMPHGATLLSSDKVNSVMGIYFKSGKSKVWGLQYHPDYEYWQMINLSSARKEKIIGNNHFDNENDFQKHLEFIKEEDKKSDFKNRTCEVKNWLDIIKIN
jgi:GMP synthase (glutamine-hydrolysing)